MFYEGHEAKLERSRIEVIKRLREQLKEELIAAQRMKTVNTELSRIQDTHVKAGQRLKNEISALVQKHELSNSALQNSRKLHAKETKALNKVKVTFDKSLAAPHQGT